MDLVFLELDTHHSHLNVKLLEESRNVTIPKIFLILINRLNCRPAKIIEVEAHFQDKIARTKKLAEKMQHLAAISNTVCTGSICTAAIPGSLCILVFVSGWDLPIGIALSDMSILIAPGKCYFSKVMPMICCKARET